jgi:hypothetical protein
METAFEAVFVAGFAVVAASLCLVATGRASERLLLALTAGLAVAAAAALAALGVNTQEEFVDDGVAVLAAAGLFAATVAEAGLLALVHGLTLVRDREELIRAGREHIEAVLEAHAKEQSETLERTLVRERANASHALNQQERRLTLERRDLIARQADRARAELAGAIEHIQEQLEQRLTAWAADLDRGQRSLETRLNGLAQRQAEAIKAYEARLTADSDYLRTATEEQQTALARLRTELAEVGQAALETARGEIEIYAEEQRRALQEITVRLRDQERSVREQVEREEADATVRIQASFTDIERRQRDNLDRALERAAQRLSDEAERRFDSQIKESREKSAQRLSHELDKAMQQFARQAEKEISDRIDEAAHAATGRLERRIADITRAAEAQHEVAAERLRQMSDRLGQALEQADARILAFEEQLELQMNAKLEHLGQSIRSADV